jgi:hypothetical protein
MYSDQQLVEVFPALRFLISLRTGKTERPLFSSIGGGVNGGLVKLSGGVVFGRWMLMVPTIEPAR